MTLLNYEYNVNEAYVKQNQKVELDYESQLPMHRIEAKKRATRHINIFYNKFTT